MKSWLITYDDNGCEKQMVVNCQEIKVEQVARYDIQVTADHVLIALKGEKILTVRER